MYFIKIFRNSRYLINSNLFQLYKYKHTFFLQFIIKKSIHSLQNRKFALPIKCVNYQFFLNINSLKGQPEASGKKLQGFDKAKWRSSPNNHIFQASFMHIQHPSKRVIYNRLKSDIHLYHKIFKSNSIPHTPNGMITLQME